MARDRCTALAAATAHRGMDRAGDFARVPLIIGPARDEGMLHTLAYKKVSADELSRGGEGPRGSSRAGDLGLRPLFDADLYRYIPVFPRKRELRDGPC